MTNTKILSKTARALKNFSEGEIVFIETDVQKMMDVHLAIVNLLSKEKYVQLILSASRPCKNLLQLYQQNGIDASRVILFCAQCQEKERQISENSKVIHLSSSSALTEMAIAVNKSMESISEKKVLFIDSLSSMAIHNSSNLLARFIHSTITRTRIHQVPGILLSLEEETDKELSAEITQLCDKVVKV